MIFRIQFKCCRTRFTHCKERGGPSFCSAPAHTSISCASTVTTSTVTAYLSFKAHMVLRTMRNRVLRGTVALRFRQSAPLSPSTPTFLSPRSLCSLFRPHVCAHFLPPNIIMTKRARRVCTNLYIEFFCKSERCERGGGRQESGGGHRRGRGGLGGARGLGGTAKLCRASPCRRKGGARGAAASWLCDGASSVTQAGAPARDPCIWWIGDLGTRNRAYL